MLSPSSAILLAAAAALVLLFGVLRFTRRRAGWDPESAGTSRPATVAAGTGRAVPCPGSPVPPSPLQPICAALCTWLTENDDHADAWPAFDQIVREVLTEHLGAARIRCFRVRPGSDPLEPISRAHKDRPRGAEAQRKPDEMTSISARRAPRSPSSVGLSAVVDPGPRDPLLVHVATIGQEFFAGDVTHGPLLDRLAAQIDEPWTWVWPIRHGRGTAGLIAVGTLPNAGLTGPQQRRDLGQLLTLAWLHVACREQLGIVRRTDRGSGVLTRNDFFALAARSLADSYQTHEPVVVAVVALEGLRRLDDAGQWSQRDALIERIGRLIASRVRADDLVGRFADDRFVVLLRRLDSGLGRLIAEKLVASADEVAAGPANPPPANVDPGTGPSETANAPPSVPTRTRIGLAGSGFAQPPLDALLSAALGAVDHARRQDLAIVSELERTAS